MNGPTPKFKQAVPQDLRKIGLNADQEATIKGYLNTKKRDIYREQ
jgi:hypothetical protein